MHQRRVDLLAPLLPELSPAVYPHYHKELSHEAASAAMQTFLLTLERAEAHYSSGGAAAGGGRKGAGAVTIAEASALNEHADKAISLYAHFLRCFSDGRLTAPVPIDGANTAFPPLPGATAIDVEMAAAYLDAHLSVAQLVHKRIPLDVKSRARELKSCLSRHRWLLATFKKLDPAARLKDNEENRSIVLSPGVAGSQGAFWADRAAICEQLLELLPLRIQQLNSFGK